MKSINGYLMSQDTQIARIENNKIIAIKPSLMPLYLQLNGDLIEWLESRAIDRHRVNSRLLKRLLRLTTAEDAEVAMHVNASTITDTYWVYEGSEPALTYGDVRFSQNYFDNLALNGDPDSFNRANNQELMHSRTPELTNIGSFEKCWRIENGDWWLYKNGNTFEKFSEQFICELGRLLNFNMAHCELWEKGIKSLDFTNGAKVNYEPARSLVGEDIDYFANYNKIKKLNLHMAKEYLDILLLDTVCFNMDRHTENYGFLRDINTGDFISMAPNFDNNIALISRGYPSDKTRKNDLFIRDFIELFEQIGVDYYLPVLHEEMIKTALSRVSIAVNADYIEQFISNGYTQLTNHFPVAEMES
ncbi:MAG: hypothetical protein ACOH15_11560 [Acetobacterium sp.]